MTGLMGYARTFLNGGDYAPPRVSTLDEEVARFHEQQLARFEQEGS
jgi:hypothetical protein